MTKSMSQLEQFAFYNEYFFRSKQTPVGVALALLLGWCGIHRFWLGDKKGGCIFLVFSWTLLPAFFAIIDAYCMHGLCRKHNNIVAQELYANIKEITP